jgi:hypothetical protein
MLLQPFLFSILIASLLLSLSLFLSRLTGSYLKIYQGAPAEAVKPPRTSLMDIFEMMLQAELWEVLVPAFFYSLIYPFLPFSGIRAGLFVALLIFILATLPEVLSLGTVLRLPLSFWLHNLLWRLIKLFLIFGTFGYFFN